MEIKNRLKKKSKGKQRDPHNQKESTALKSPYQEISNKDNYSRHSSDFEMESLEIWIRHQKLVRMDAVCRHLMPQLNAKKTLLGLSRWKIRIWKI